MWFQQNGFNKRFAHDHPVCEEQSKATIALATAKFFWNTIRISFCSYLFFSTILKIRQLPSNFFITFFYIYTAKGLYVLYVSVMLITIKTLTLGIWYCGWLQTFNPSIITMIRGKKAEMKILPLSCDIRVSSMSSWHSNRRLFIPFLSSFYLRHHLPPMCTIDEHLFDVSFPDISGEDLKSFHAHTHAHMEREREIE